MMPIRNFKFTLEIEGVIIGFSDVSGYDAKVKEIQYREGDSKVNMVQKLPGLLEYGQITLKRGADNNRVLLKWIEEAGNGNPNPKTVTLTALSDQGKAVAIWKVINAWPVNYSISEFKGTGNEVAMETLVLTHEGMTRDL
ncbi:phage tail protein [Anaerosporobacter sp.]|uniref:phage tail protein n=1 Tax=Anaerosporobacter sp. TaxID=1872529 RepID=UPI00286EE827|nr:phage tail protein [Anaerosporobacter sp.]